MKGNHLIAEARKRAVLTQAELASRVGTTQSAIARLERGRTVPTLERITQLVRACGFELEVRLVPQDDQEWTIAQTNKRLSPGERVDKLVAAARFVAAGRAAMAAAHGR